MRYTKANYKYQLDETEQYYTGICPEYTIDTPFIRLRSNGLLTIRQGFAWDGCTDPAIDTDTNMTAGLVHDALYWLMRQELLPEEYRKEADDLFRAICIKKGMRGFRAWYYWRGVRRFAWWANDPARKREVHTAP